MAYKVKLPAKLIHLEGKVIENLDKGAKKKGLSSKKHIESILIEESKTYSKKNDRTHGGH